MLRALTLREGIRERAVPGLMIALGAGMLFTILLDQGQLLSTVLGSASYQQNYLHELFHDGRHVVGVVCH